VASVLGLTGQYAWLVWSLLLLAVWFGVYSSLSGRRVSRKEMLLVSVWTALLGLTEPLFVPEYWDPPSLFDLARRTGFDLESIIFAFSAGGLAAVGFERLFPARHRALPAAAHHAPRHRFHALALLSAPLIFAIFYASSELNPIYSTMIALACGGIAVGLCRPDLWKKLIAGAFLFLGLYFLYFLALNAFFPGYVAQVWNLGALSGVLVAGIPLEELGFAFAFGFLWAGLYEHINWYALETDRRGAAAP